MREASCREQLAKWLEEKKVMRFELLQAKEQVSDSSVYVYVYVCMYGGVDLCFDIEASVSSAQCQQWQRVIKGSGTCGPNLPTLYSIYNSHRMYVCMYVPKHACMYIYVERHTKTVIVCMYVCMYV